ncbi:hypothetical protein EUTSA_v10006865mg [Eutrema salsugineum]|uniref:Uncharacterized protein n=1 Tax=Eutrema salsugineum TaxID=72664 RepID=V4L282_EUTSA|nr:hypothetical protein EUTSA_v10006865mg [Eutrema salsugineum]
MEEATKVSSEVPVDVYGEMRKEDKVMEKEEEDTTFDGGFVKVEKEGIHTKDEEKTEKQKLQEQIAEGEERNISQLKSSEDSLQLHEKLTKVLKEKEVLETSVAEITSNAAKTKEFCDELEEKLKISDEKFSKTDALLSQALSKNSDLEQKLKNLEEFSEEVSQLKSALIVAEEEGKNSSRQMQEYQEQVTKLESSLNQSSARISELEEDLVIALQKGAEHEDLGNASTQRSVELEGLLQASQSKLEKAEEKLKDLEAFQAKNSSLEASLSVAMEKERDLSENLNAVMNEKKLKSAEERLEKQAREINEAITRSIELEALHKHSEVRIQKTMEEFSSRDTEAKSLAEKSKDLEERIRLYEEKLAEASAHSFSLKEELELSTLKNEFLADTNNELKIKIQELEGFLDFEKETAARQTEEATKRFNQRDIEANDLITKLKSHENLIEEHKRQVLEASGVADTRKMELEEALSKLKAFEATIKELEKENGSLAEVNLKLNQKLADHGSETSDFQAMFSALEAEKDQTAKELQASKTTIEEVTNQLTSEGERLRSQMSSLAEENNQVNEIYQSTKNELVKLQEQLQVEKTKSDAMVSEIKNLSAVAAEKLVLESNFEEVEKQLKKAEAQLKEEVEKVAELTSKLHEHDEQREAVSQKHLELEATLKKSQEELEAKKSKIVHLESLVKDLEQKVQLADSKSKETESMAKEEIEVKSRDIGLSFSTPKQQKSKKMPDASPSLSSSSGNVTIQKAETWHLMTLKTVLAVALVSVIIGIILGKKY